MKVLITSATSIETDRIKQKIHAAFTKSIQVNFHVGGIGILSTCYSLTKIILEQKPDVIIQAGIAGCFDETIALGKVVAVKDEFIGDLGVEENGMFNDLFDMKFEQANAFPYTNKGLVNPHLSKFNLLGIDEVTGLTINEISTRGERIEQLKSKYNPVIESMEGAALHYVGLLMQVPFIQIRSVSNYVGERDKAKWRFDDAVKNLSSVVLSYLNVLQQNK